MDHKTWLSSYSEARTIAEYTKHGWHVFDQVSGKAPFDLIAYKDGEVRRVTVKASTQKSRSGKNSYNVELRSIRSNRTKNKINLLNKDQFDEIVVYIEPLDVLYFFKPEEVGTSILTINTGLVYREVPWK